MAFDKLTTVSGCGVAGGPCTEDPCACDRPGPSIEVAGIRFGVDCSDMQGDFILGVGVQGLGWPNMRTSDVTSFGVPGVKMPVTDVPANRTITFQGTACDDMDCGAPCGSAEAAVQKLSAAMQVSCGTIWLVYYNNCGDAYGITGRVRNFTTDWGTDHECCTVTITFDSDIPDFIRLNRCGCTDPDSYTQCAQLGAVPGDLATCMPSCPPAGGDTCSKSVATAGSFTFDLNCCQWHPEPWTAACAVNPYNDQSVSSGVIGYDRGVSLSFHRSDDGVSYFTNTNGDKMELDGRINGSGSDDPMDTCDCLTLIPYEVEWGRQPWEPGKVALAAIDISDTGAEVPQRTLRTIDGEQEWNLPKDEDVDLSFTAWQPTASTDIDLYSVAFHGPLRAPMLYNQNSALAAGVRGNIAEGEVVSIDLQRMTAQLWHSEESYASGAPGDDISSKVKGSGAFRVKMNDSVQLLTFQDYNGEYGTGHASLCYYLTEAAL